jgi:hypothetical protein
MERRDIFTAAQSRRQTARRRRIDSAHQCARPNPATIGGFPTSESNAPKSVVSGDFLNCVNAPDPAAARIAKFPERAFINNSSWICHEAPA